MYTYEIECAGMSITDGKVVPKELTEDQKVDDPKAAKGGKPPPKDAKKGKEEEPTPEELEKME